MEVNFLMNKTILLIHLIIFLPLLSSSAHSFSSSSYLIAQSAIALNDYETASKHYEIVNLSNMSSYDLQKKLIAFVNSNNLFKASIVAKEIIDLDASNQEAWQCMLAAETALAGVAVCASLRAQQVVL